MICMVFSFARFTRVLYVLLFGGRLRFLEFCGKRQQRDVARLLDGTGEAALVCSANAGEPPRHNLAALGHELLQQPHIAVRDGVDLVGAELAHFLAAKEFATAAGTA
jgi:hypothetical protein